MNEITTKSIDNGLSKIESVLIVGDLARLNEQERVFYYKSVCESVGLNPLTKPFDYITLNGRLTLYARKDATDQLRTRHNVSIKIVDAKVVGDVYLVIAEASQPNGRTDSSTGAVPIAGLKGDAMANAYMKAETKAKRRVTLSICGLGLLDETEVADIPAKDKNPMAMGHANNDLAGNGIIDNPKLGYRIPFGKFKDRSLEEIDSADLISYVDYLEATAEKKGQLIQGQVKEFIDNVDAYIGALENQPLEPGAIE